MLVHYAKIERCNCNGCGNVCNAQMSLFLICKRRTVNYFDDGDDVVW